VNRAPRQKTDGTPGEKRDVLLELLLLADVGMLGYLMLVNQHLFAVFQQLNLKSLIILLQH